MKAISLTGTERRQAERFVLELPALLSMRDGNRKPVSCEVMTRDISSEGAFFLNCKSIPVGSDVKVNLMLFLEDRYKLKKEKIHIDIKGRVVRADEHGVAVCFDRKYKIFPNNS